MEFLGRDFVEAKNVTRFSKGVTVSTDRIVITRIMKVKAKKGNGRDIELHASGLMLIRIKMRPS